MTTNRVAVYILPGSGRGQGLDPRTHEQEMKIQRLKYKLKGRKEWKPNKNKEEWNKF